MNKEFWLCLILICSAVALLFSPYLIGPRLSFGEDITDYYLPVFKAYSEALKNKESIYLLPGLLSGFPIFLSQSGGWLDPINRTLFSVFDFAAAYDFRIFVNYLLAGIFIFLFAKRIMSDWAAFFSSLVFLGGLNLTLGMNILISNSFFVIPLLFYGLFSIAKLEKIISLKFLVYCVLAGMGLGIGWLGGYTQVIVYSVVFSSLFVLFLILFFPKEEFRRANLLIGLLTIMMIGFLIGYPFISAAYNYIPLSLRSQGIGLESIFSGSILFADLIHLFIPPTFSLHEKIAGFSTTGSSFLFISFASLFLAISVFLNKTISGINKRLSLFFAIASIFCLLAAVSGSPLFEFINLLPGLKYFRMARNLIPFFLFSASIVSGIGFDGVQNFSLNSRGRKVLYAFSAISFLVLLIFYHTVFNYSERYFEAFGSFGNAPLGWSASLYSLLFLIQIILGALLVSSRISKSSFKKIALVSILGFIFLSLGAKLSKEVVQNSDLKRVSPIAEFIRSVEPDPKKFRVFSFAVGLYTDSSGVVSIRKFSKENALTYPIDIMEPNTNLFSGISTVEGYDNFMSRRYADVLAVVGGRKIPNLPFPPHAYVNLLNNRNGIFDRVKNILGMMNVKYMTSSIDLARFDSTKSGIEKVFRHQELGDVPIYVFENKYFLEQFYIPRKVEFVENDRGLEKMLNTKERFSSLSFISCSECGPGFQNNSLNSGLISEYKNGKIVIETNFLEQGWGILTVNFLPDWSAKINGQKTPIYYANHTFMGLNIPAGKSKIELEYKPNFKLF